MEDSKSGLTTEAAQIENETKEAAEITPDQPTADLQDANAEPQPAEPDTSSDAIEEPESNEGESDNHAQSTEGNSASKANSFCPKCGSPIKEGQTFCGSCGAKVDDSEGGKETKNKIKPKTIGIVGGIVAAVIIAIVLVTFVIPELTKTPIDLIKENNWEQAYSKASDEEKDNVLIANLSACMSKDPIIDGLKDPSSFDLREAYFSKSSHALVLYVGGKNSYGGVVASYYYFTWSKDKGEFSLYTSLSDLDDETIYKYADSSSEKIEKTLKNAARKTVKSIIEDSNNKLNNDYVDAINYLFSEGKLKDVTLLGDVTAKLGANTNA